MLIAPQVIALFLNKKSYLGHYHPRNRSHSDGESSYIDLIGGKQDMNYISYVYWRTLLLSFVFGIRFKFHLRVHLLRLRKEPIQATSFVPEPKT